MVFSSVTFVLVFLPIVLIMYLLTYLHVHTRKLGLMVCNSLLLIFSLLFYAWGEPKYVLILLVSIFINFHMAFLVSPHSRLVSSRSLRHACMALNVILNLGILGYFKYAMFFAENGFIASLNAILPHSLHIDIVQHIALPLGISFYTFQGMSYVIDVYRGECKPSRSIINFACYLSMFPQLVAGPVVRYVTIASQLVERTLNAQIFSEGVQRFVLGLAKKMLIADTVGRVADAAFSIPTQELPALAAWAGILCYSLQIYYDFSGYSDMAVGLGKMFGFTFPENFNYPYAARSIKDFWRRWHMTLSSWFKDYLYIPLGGNRCGTVRVILNLFIVFALCGFWHGAGWVFLLWGLYHGCFLVFERLFPRAIASLPPLLQHGYTILTFMIGWVLFRATTLEHAVAYMKSLLGMHEMGIQANRVWLELFAGDVYLALIEGMIFSFPVLPALRKAFDSRLNTLSPVYQVCMRSLVLSGVLGLFGLCLMPLFGATYNAFIYFRF